jgi:predicted Zn finger-like uncharacterized protein
MILVCPNCSTRYSVPDGAFGAGGRQVKCTRCAHAWWQAPDEQLAAAPGTLEATPEPPSDIEPIPDEAALPAARVPEAADEQAEPGHPRTVLSPASSGHGRRVAAGWAFLALFVVAIAAALSLGREELVRAWPPIARLYAAAGAPATSSEEALLLRNTRPEWQVEGGQRTLLITAEIANHTDAGQTVPPIRISLRDDKAAEIHAETVKPDVAELGPGETAPFRARILPPATSAAEVSLSFSPSR